VDADERLVGALKEAGIDFVCWLPCSLLSRTISLLEEDEDVRTVRVSREEEGVGICAGAWMAGREPALIMQNSGLGNSINALCSLNLTYNVPILLVMSHRGYLDEDIPAQVPMGKVAPKVIEVMNMHLHFIEDVEELDRIPSAWRTAKAAREPVAVFLSPRLWG